jgi:hypothetical protein
MDYELPAAAGSPPQLHAVILVEVDEDCDLIQLPSKPWPQHVRLSREAQPDVVSLIVGTLATWGREKDDWSIEALERDFPIAVPGGFAAVEQGRVIGPSCCCGLETWRQWLDVLNTRRSPWMGHDPSPFVEIREDRVNIWADGGLGGNSRDSAPIAFSLLEFETAVAQAAKDLVEFEEPLRKWLGFHAPRYEHNLAAKFRESFILCREVE